MRSWRDSAPGTGVARWMLLPVVAGLPVLGWLRYEGTRRGLFSDAAGTAMMVAAALVIVGAIVTTVARRLNRMASERDAGHAQLASVLGAATEYGIVATDRSGVVTLFNRGAEIMLGHRAEDLLGRPPPLELFDPGELAVRAAELGVPPGVQAFTGSVAPDHSETREWTMVRRDGTRVPVSLTVSAIVVDGQVAGYTAVARDVSQERRVLEELRRSSQHLDEILQLSPVALVITRIADGRMVRINDAWKRDYGYEDESDVVGRTSLEIGIYAHAEDRVPIREALERGERVISHQIELCRRDGEVRQMLLSAQRLDIDDDAFLLGATIDVTERLRIERELERLASENRLLLDAALDASRMKSEFLATMSHEIRTPMNAVIGMTSLLLRTELSAEQREYAEQVRTAGEALLTLIGDILDFSKIEAGRIELEAVAFELRAALEDAAEIVATPAHAKGLELAVAVDPALPARVVGDVTRVRQILLNLLSNAVKFTPAGEIVMRAALAEDAEGSDGRTIVHFEVRDSGVGIAPDDQQRLFDSFTQADASTTRHFGGTGLGLAICRRLAELMDGTIGVRSAPGEGSTFWFRIPVAVAPGNGGPSAAPDDGLAQRLEGSRGLVAGDNATTCELLAAQLRSWRLQSDVAGGGRAALDALRAAAAAGRPYGLVVTDLAMADLDGFALARAIADDARITAPVIALSSRRAEDAAEARRIAVVSDVLSKPARSSRLFEAVAAALGAPLRTASTAPPAARPAPGTAHGERLLVVDDNAVNRRVATLMLEGAGYRVDARNDGRAALEALRTTSYAAVLMDLEMPVMDGWTVIEAIRRGEAGPATIPVIALSAAALEEDRRRALAVGADAHVAKPIRPEELERALTASLRAARTGRPTAPVAAPVAAREGRGEAVSGRPAPAILDAGRRAELHALDGSGAALDRLTELFCGQAGERVQAMGRLIGAEDAEGVRRIAHELRGSAATIGFARLAAVCAQLEASATDGVLPPAGCVDRLAGELRAASEALVQQPGAS